ncbi:hypothetical protein C3K47_02895 [Solitalea longa]|uniref:Uncharacterized protein n=1 Tax=Solitalea longa TaxID=2079460 RepID=A0A2S5A6Z1_9SPHI|nr:hypothetical protein [Solitalea longa]POY38361.1 hypothetical protein C3K47_02895 [Solitalea longa]
MIKHLVLLSVFVVVFNFFADAQNNSNAMPVSQAELDELYNQQTSRQMRDNFNNFWKNRGKEHPDQKSYSFKVILKDSSELKCKSKIYFSDSVTYILYKSEKTGDSIKITPKETQNILMDDVFLSKNIEGISTDSCWLFKTIKGKINVYSFYPMAPKNSTETIAYLQKGDGPLVRYSPKQLLRMVGKNKRSVKLCVKQKYMDALTQYNGD